MWCCTKIWLRVIGLYKDAIRRQKKEIELTLPPFPSPLHYVHRTPLPFRIFVS